MLSEHAVDENLDEENQLEMELLYQNYHRRLKTAGKVTWAPWYMSITANLASKMWDRFESLRKYGGKDTLEWFATISA